MKKLLFALAWTLAVTATQAQNGLPEPLPTIDLLSVRTPAAVAERIPLEKDFLKRLRTAGPGQKVPLQGLVRKQGREVTLAFRPVALYAPGAKVRVVDAHGSTTLSSKRRFFLAVNGRTAAGLALNEDGSLQGMLMEQGELYDLKQAGNDLLTRRIDIHRPDLTTQCLTGDTQRVAPIDQTTRQLKRQFSHNLAKGTINYSTVVAVDTDNEWMSGKFGNNTTAARTWIEDLFLAMNVFYNRDLSLFLQLGDVFLRTTTDPYTGDGTTNGTLIDDLDEFGLYWKNNMNAVSRDFAMMFSGKIASTSFSGLAWIDIYCNNGVSCNGGSNTCGSYSFNAIGSSSAITPNWASTLVGHELGHNLGSVHTHCYSPPLDNCWNQESGCYSNATSCPAGGGTIMSYCHLLSGCSSNAEFHPTVIALLNGQISANYPSCIDAYATTADLVFVDGFE